MEMYVGQVYTSFSSCHTWGYRDPAGKDWVSSVCRKLCRFCPPSVWVFLTITWYPWILLSCCLVLRFQPFCLGQTRGFRGHVLHPSRESFTKTILWWGALIACTLLPCLVASSSSLLRWAVVGLGSFLPLCFCCTSLSPLQHSAITLALALGCPSLLFLLLGAVEIRNVFCAFFPYTILRTYFLSSRKLAVINSNLSGILWSLVG